MYKQWIAMLLALGGACVHANEPPSDAAATAKPAAAVKSEDGGQRRAEKAGFALLGQPGPAAVLQTIDGERIDLSQLYGRKPVYLKFWATWCVPCREQMPGFERDFETLGDRIAIVAVNTGFNDDGASVQAYRRKFGLRMPIAIDDGSLAAALNLRVTPQHVVIGRDGRILYVGHLEDERLHRALDAALAQEGTAATVRARASEPVFRPGDTPRGIDVATSDGKPYPLVGDSRDAGVRALVFFSPWCESYLASSQPATARACRRVREEMNAQMARTDVHWLGVASGLWASVEDLRAYRNDPGTSAPLTLDETGRLFRAFDVHEIPTVVVLDRHGRIVRKLGPGDTDLAAALDAARRVR